MKREMRKELLIGLLLNATFLVLNRFIDIQPLFFGVLFGLGICLMLVGGLPEKPYKALKNRKKSFVQSR